MSVIVIFVLPLGHENIIVWESEEPRSSHWNGCTASWAAGVCGQAGKPDGSRADWNSPRKGRREQEAPAMCQSSGWTDRKE